MPGIYDSWLVCLSVVIAVIDSYTAVRLAARAQTIADHSLSRIWLAAGAIQLGTGVWSMHFIGMMAWSLPITLAYGIPRTVASLAIAIVCSGLAMVIANGPRARLARLVGGALMMGGGISAMHYLGMAAIPITPGITYDSKLVALSVLIAVGASFVVLWLLLQLGGGTTIHHRITRKTAALLMGAAISGVHYTGVAAATIAAGSYCRGGIQINNTWFAATLGLCAFGSLALALVITIYDARLQSRTQSDAKKLEEVHARLLYQATHDALTKLPNRTLFIETLEQDITESERREVQFAVLAVDLDRFKVINDTLGYGVGDRLLVEAACRICAAVRVGDIVARTGADEFLLLIRDLREVAHAGAVAAKIIAALEHEFRIDDAEIHISGSIGISLCAQDGIDASLLVARADEALYFAKQRGRHTYQYFNPSMSVFSHERLNLENDLRRALELRQLEVHYQPKFDVAGGGMSSVEALLRWRHPVRGLVSPGEFIPLAEEIGIMFAIGEWVLGESCRQARAWQRAGLGPIQVAVNVSPVYFRQLRFLDAVRAALLEHDLEPQFLEIELTENAVMDDAEASIRILEELCRMGVMVSIDDFGTGYSSMSYLRRFPIHGLKIDRSFICDLTTSDDAASIVSAIISLAHSLRLQVVAEGVETAEQLERLKKLGCDQYQGFYKSPAVPASGIEAIVRSLGVPTGSRSKVTPLKVRQQSV